MRELEGKVVIVTGGGKARSVGYGVARALARHGTNLAVTGPSKGKLTAAKELEGEFGVKVLPLKVEHPDEKSTVEALAQVVERLGRVDALVNCALVAKNGTPLARVKSSELSTALEYGPVAVQAWMKAAYPHLRDAKGSVVNFLPASEGHASTGVLSAAGAAVAALSTVAAKEWAAEGITVNMVRVLARTAQLERLEQEFPADYEAALASVPTGRFSEVEDEVGETCAYLLGSAARNVTGQTIALDGGFRLGA